MTKKEIVDKYVQENYQYICLLKTKPEFKQNGWQKLADQIKNEGSVYTQAIDKEYLRGRFNDYKEKIPGNTYLDDVRVIPDKSLQEYLKESSVNTTLPGYLTQYSFQENRDKGEAKLEDTVAEKLLDSQIYEKYSVDPEKYKISQVWYKDKQVGFHMSVLFTSIKSEVSIASLTDEFDKFVGKYNKTILSKPSNTPKKREVSSRDCLYLQTLSDIHVGNFQKKGYISSIKERIKETMRSIENVGITKFLILNTGDMIHFDSSRSDTFGNTQLTGEMTYESAFTQALDLCTDLIDYASTLALEVTFVNVRGNHSYDTEYCLGEALKKVYSKNTTIEIINQNDNNFRTYYYWNNNAFLFAHGDKAIDKLPLLFATEGNEVFSKAKYRHVILGHLHHNQAKQFTNTMGEFNGIEVRVCGSPTSTDIWHKQNGFVGANKNLISFIFTPKEGKYAEYNFKLI